MSDEIDRDLLPDPGESADTDGAESGSLDPVTLDPDLFPEADLTGGTPTTVPDSKRSAARSRLGGLLALALGVLGSALMLLLAAVVIRFGFTASDTVDRVMEPVRVSFDRMETRIDETDDLVDRDGIESDEIDELQARVDGLVDISTGAHQVFEAVEDHPVYRFLPAELSTLGDALAEFEESSLSIDATLGDVESGDSVDAATAGQVADELDGMQGRVSDVRDLISSAASSLRRWIRFASFLGFLGALWGLWGQTLLARRGWRGSRGREL
ncbi:MAG: hypothetical protein ACR2QK_23795 [Acidimicrobiales bacterium]